MAPDKRLFFAAGLAFAILAACSFSKSIQGVTTTQIAEQVFASQTSLALSATPTYTPSPTASSAPTPLNTPTLIPSSTPPPTNTPFPTLDPSILFSDDFSDPNSGWYEYSDEYGGSEYAQGRYLFSIDATETSYWSTPSRFYRDVIIDVDAKKISGPEENEFGVLCRVENNSNFYLFAITSDGYYGFFKMEEGEWKDVDSTGWLFNDSVILSGSRVNHIRVTCNGEALTMEVNGSILLDITDADFLSGDVGLYAGSYYYTGVRVQFDNFIVTRP